MEFVTMRQLKHQTPGVLRLSQRKGPVVVTRNGRPVAVLRAATLDDLAMQVEGLWGRFRQAAKRVGLRRQDVDRVIAHVRAQSS